MNPEQTVEQPQDSEDLIESNEHVLIVVRKHWIGIAGIYIMAALLIIAIVALGAYVMPGLNLSSQAVGLTVFGSILVAIVFALILTVIIYIYNKSSLTLTDKSCVQLVQKSLFNRKISRLSMSNVEDVNVEQRGIIASMFNFGTLTIQTAGEEDNFVFSFCPSPNYYAERILEARQAYVQHREV